MNYLGISKEKEQIVVMIVFKEKKSRGGKLDARWRNSKSSVIADNEAW